LIREEIAKYTIFANRQQQ